VFVLVAQHQVEDYATWKAAFDKFPPSEGGGVFHRIHRMVSDPNTLTVVAGFESLEEAEAFAANPDLADTMEKGGVVGELRIEVYEQAEFVEY
jgi:hypothetical protein